MNKVLHILSNAKKGPSPPPPHFLPEKCRNQRMLNKEQRANFFQFVISWIKSRDRLVKHLLLLRQ